ncbi:hypothetical protein MWU58_10400 [Flavobacteriaceae bacterium S0825]|uniref:hypothetical protein n=1 Tax=Gaetbulibacter sp. S0825 TaxID=2720084 RepID=UPI00142FE46C|nr:hypothetical protein [Gaetbulibacter sp. S0825]MCK0109706.1 hypothetical protein [Flavobacteriaceae bacterium S0825]NIX65338.1 hypothetical protein [Gaetbulibacter sp. S0825]
MKFSHYIWAIYLIVFPFYMFAEGNPQLADLFGALLIIVNIKSILTSISANRYTKYLFLFVVYTFIVNTILMLMIGDIKILKNSVFYLYSFFMMLFIFNRLKDISFLEITFKALSVSLIVQTLLFPFIKDQGVRTQMFFNNPNQLALWGLCLLAIIYVLTRLLNKKTPSTVVLLALCTLFILISASRAALGGAIIFWIFFIIKSRKNLMIFAAASVIAFIVIDFNYDLNLENFAALEYNMDRFSNNTISGNQGIGTRGFQRIGKNPQHLLFGAGEGAYERFNETIELHSIFANILFCYGIIGLFLYLGAFKSFATKLSRETMAVIFPVLLFAAVHMTLRLPLFWIALLFVLYLHEEKIRTNNFLSTD